MNYLAILIVVVVQQLIGFVWYSPMLFSQAWKESVGLDETGLTPNATPFISAVIASTFLAYVMTKMVQHFHCKTIEDGAKLGFMVWLGFIAPVIATHYLFIGFEFNAIAIDTGKELLGLIVSGIILTMWRKK